MLRFSTWATKGTAVKIEAKFQTI